MQKRSQDARTAGQFVGKPGTPAKSPSPRRKPDKWETEARQIVRAEMERRGQSYKTLALKLEAQGYPETERRLISRITRGSFSFAFALRCLRVLGVEHIDIRKVI